MALMATSDLEESQLHYTETGESGKHWNRAFCFSEAPTDVPSTLHLMGRNDTQPNWRLICKDADLIIEPLQVQDRAV